MCGAKGGGNSAVYGPCRASTCQRLIATGIPTIMDPAFPGLPFELIWVKKVVHNLRIIYL